MNDNGFQKAKPGHLVLLDNEEYVIDRIDIGAYKAYLRDMENGELKPISIDKLLVPDEDTGETPIIAKNREDLYKRRQMQVPPEHLVVDANLPDKLFGEAKLIVNIVDRVRKKLLQYGRISEARNEKFKRKEAIVLALKELDINLHWRTFYNYEKFYKKAHGDPEKLAVIKRRSDFRKTRHSSAELHLVHKAIMRYGRFLKPRLLLERIEGILKATKGFWIDPRKFAGDIPEVLIEELLDPDVSIDFLIQHPDYEGKFCRASPPKKSWFFERVKWFFTQKDGGREFINKLLGEGAWEEEYKVFDAFAQRAQYSNQYVFADHYLIDVFNVDEENRSVIDRLWLTLLIDAYSRAILGYCLTYEKPCAETLLLGLKSMVYPKSVQHKYGVEKPWICFGIPQFLFLDNAWAHYANDIKRVAKEISQDGEYPSIDLVFRVPYMANHGALIERFFGNLAAKIKTALAGSIKNSNPKWVSNAVKSACLIYDDIDEFIVKIIVNYMHTPHSALHMMTPHDKYLQGLKYTELPDYPDFTDEFDQLFWRTVLGTRTIQDEGVEWNGLTYWAQELTVLPRFLPFVGSSDGTKDSSTRRQKRMPYSLRYNTENISEIALYKDGKFICLLKAKQFRQADGSYREISLWEWEMAKALMPSRKTATAELVKLLLETDEKNAIRLKEKQEAMRKARKQNQLPPVPAMSPAEIAEAMRNEEQEEIDKELNNFMFSDSAE